MFTALMCGLYSTYRSMAASNNSDGDAFLSRTSDA